MRLTINILFMVNCSLSDVPLFRGLHINPFPLIHFKYHQPFVLFLHCPRSVATVGFLDFCHFLLHVSTLDQDNN